MNKPRVQLWIRYGIAFFLGMGILLIWQSWPLMLAQMGRTPQLKLVVPVITEAGYTFRHVRGFEAQLYNDQGQRLQFPRMWLPGDAQPGTHYRVITKVSPSPEESTFTVLLVAE